MRESSDSRVPGHVGLFLSNRGNRRILRDWVGAEYPEVTVASDPADLAAQDCDLYVLDFPAFDAHREELVGHKQAADPALLPFLLVHPADHRPGEDQLGDAVDELLSLPTGQRELAWRIDTLLRLRSMSLQLVATNQQIEELARAAAHDLRNPLQVAKLLVPQLDADDQTVRRIRRSLDRMESLIEKVLAVAHTGEKITAEAQAIDFAALVRECWDLVPTQNATLELAVETPLTLEGDTSLAHQLVENLIRNAVTHGGPDVTIEVGLLSEGTGFYVADDGPGIPSEEREAVFESGFSTASGSGLGLAVVERAADAHGWGVSVTDSRWGGARFEVADVDEADADPPP